jgi:uncharacterized protein
MTKMIFVNLPVADVEASARFYEAIGATRNEQFSQEGVAASMVFSNTIHFMLLSHTRFADFTPKQIIDPHTEVQALLCLSAESREEVDRTLERAAAAGGRVDPITPEEVNDFMYGRSFSDPDGHGIELMWMDMAAFTANAPAEAAA